MDPWMSSSHPSDATDAEPNALDCLKLCLRHYRIKQATREGECEPIKFGCKNLAYILIHIQHSSLLIIKATRANL